MLQSRLEQSIQNKCGTVPALRVTQLIGEMDMIKINVKRAMIKPSCYRTVCYRIKSKEEHF